ncbi:unnamed protein product [Moneuplotes crassus]|uniref:Uncharacterized protein n=1 Tax=Euplotes crassus TaxID=5936 RepID=A0AAD1U6S6_EUPCR|nr:unnamed protein product [Moneuplotes crassus]
MSLHSSPRRLREFDSVSGTAEISSQQNPNDSEVVQDEDFRNLRAAITDLYLDVKIRSSDDIDNYNTPQFDKEKDRLKQLNLSTIVSYIKASIEILMNMKLDESEYKLRESKYHPSSKPYFRREDKPVEESKISSNSQYDVNREYEIAIQKLEADIRNHIRIEQQLKLHIESVHSKIEEIEERWHQAESDKIHQQRRFDQELSKLKDSLLQKNRTISQLTADLENEKKTSSEKSCKIEKFEAKIKEVEQRYIKDIMILQGELSKLKEEEGYKTMFNSNPHNLTAHSQRKLSKAIKLLSSNCTPINVNRESQNGFKNHKKLSISNGNHFNKIKFQEPKTSKLTKNRPKGEIQRNLLKGYIKSKGDKETSSGILELSTRTPDKTNTEVSPYMVDMYRKNSKPYNEQLSHKMRSSSNCLKYSKAMKLNTNDSPMKSSRKTMLKKHKKSKSQTSIGGLKSMDHRNSGVFFQGSDKLKKMERKNSQKPQHFHDNNNRSNKHKRHLTDPRVSVISIQKNLYNTYHSKKKSLKNQQLDKKKKKYSSKESISTVRHCISKENPDSGVYYQQSSRKAPPNSIIGSIFSANDFSNMSQMKSSGSSFLNKHQRRCVSSIGCYLKDDRPNPGNSFNRYPSEMSGTKIEVKAKQNSSMV